MDNPLDPHCAFFCQPFLDLASSLRSGATEINSGLTSGLTNFTDTTELDFLFLTTHLVLNQLVLA